MTIHKFRDGIRHGRLFVAELTVLLASEYPISKVPVTDHNQFWHGLRGNEERVQSDILEYAVLQDRPETIKAWLVSPIGFEELRRFEGLGIIFNHCGIYKEIKSLEVLAELGT